MKISSELMPKHEWDGCVEHYDALPELAKRLMRHSQWLLEHIETISPDKKSERHFQLREKQRTDSERTFP